MIHATSWHETYTLTHTGLTARLPASYFTPGLSHSIHRLYHHLTMSFSDRRRDGGEGRGVQESTFYNRQLVQRFWSSMSFLSSTSAKDIHWTSSFLQPPTDFWRKGHRSILHLLSDLSTHRIPRTDAQAYTDTDAERYTTTLTANVTGETVNDNQSQRRETSQRTSQTSRIASVSTTEASTSLADGNRYSGRSILNQSCSLHTNRTLSLSYQEVVEVE